tara:strand:+ start:1005 stop:1676 length:672 start_codon:yes stop_codon:yes gene_type:complete
MKIVSPWRDRRNYVSIMLTTLHEAMRRHDDVQVHLYDNESIELAPPIALEMSSVNRLKFYNIVAHDCHHVFIDMFNHAFETCDDDHIINIDSDCCVHPAFISAAKKMIEQLPDLGHASLYSEGNHPEPKEKVHGIYHVRPHISMTASIISRAAWEAFKKPKPGEEIRFGCIDGAFSTFVHESAEFGCYSTVNSYVDHIGAHGAYSQVADDGASTAHRARRFVS